MKLFVRNLSFNKYILSCLFLLLFSKLFAQQNLVENPSFDHVIKCLYYGPEAVAEPWDTIRGLGYGTSSPFYNYCSINVGLNVPTTYCGIQNTRSGDGMCSLDFFGYYPTNKRCYTKGRLKQTLQANKNYTTTFYVSRCAGSKYSTDALSIYFDDNTIMSNCFICLVNKNPQVQNTPHNVIYDTVAWTKIQGCFNAIGNESNLTLGIFRADSLLDAIVSPYNGYGLTETASYFIDDVSVVESGSSVQAGPDTLINKGDTALLGAWLEGMPVEWYNIDGSLLANSSQVLVSPSQTTSYIVKMDLCGFMSQDTLTVFVNPLGINSTAAQQEPLQISPNPATNLLMIQSANMLIKEVKIWDVLGRMQLGNEQIRKLDNEKHIEIEISSLSKGIYFIKVMDKNGNFKTRKFVKE